MLARSGAPVIYDYALTEPIIGLFRRRWLLLQNVILQAGTILLAIPFDGRFEVIAIVLRDIVQHRTGVHRFEILTGPYSAGVQAVSWC